MESCVYFWASQYRRDMDIVWNLAKGREDDEGTEALTEKAEDIQKLQLLLQHNHNKSKLDYSQASPIILFTSKLAGATQQLH